jgi:glycosyltransferase involved in cell wall biosynthesis
MGAVDVSIVIPVYNSAEILPVLASGLLGFIESRRESFEVILVVDGSPDDSWNVARDLCSRHRGVFRGILLSRNFGQHSATLCGLKAARGEVVVTMDDDLQHAPADIGLLLGALEATGADVVIAKLTDKKHSLLRRAASRLMRLLTERLLSKPKGLHLSSFRAMRRWVARGVLEIQTAYPYLPALLFAVTRNAVNVEVEHHRRHGGASNYRFLIMLALASKLVLNNSSLMLDLLGFLGILSAGASFAGAAYLVAKKLIYGIPVPGWTSLLVSLYLIGGFLLMGMGIVGKYLLRLLRESTHHPNYFVSRRTDDDE